MLSKFLFGSRPVRPERHRHSLAPAPPPPPRPPPPSQPTLPPTVIYVGGSNDHEAIRVAIRKVYSRDSPSSKDGKESGHSYLVLDRQPKGNTSHSKTYETFSYHADDIGNHRKQDRESPPPRPHSRAGSRPHSTYHRSTEYNNSESNKHSSSYERAPKVAVYYSRNRDNGEDPIFLQPSSSQHHPVRHSPIYVSERDHGFSNDKYRSNGRRRSPIPSYGASSRLSTTKSKQHSKPSSHIRRSSRRSDLIPESSRSARPVQSIHRQSAHDDEYSTKVNANKDGYPSIYPRNESQNLRHNLKDQTRHVRFLLPYEGESTRNAHSVHRDLFLQQFHPEQLSVSNRPKTPPNWSTHIHGRPRPQGYYNRRGDQLVRKGVIVRQKDPSLEWADIFSGYPEPGMGWRDEKGHWLPEGGGILRDA